MLKKIIKLNLDDLWLYFGVEGGLFLLLEIVFCCVMYFVRPEDGVTVGCILMPITAGFISFIAGISHVSVSFDQALRFGQTRRRAVGLTLGLMAFEGAFGMALAALLAALERLVCPALWARLAGMDGWVAGRSGVIAAAPAPEGMEIIPGRFFESMTGELLPLPENTLFVETFTLEWYWWLLAFAVGLCGGIIAGALIQRFGTKGGWIVYGVCFGPMILAQVLPWKTYEITNWLFPMLGVLAVAGLVWSIWSMLHAVVRA